MTEETYLTTDEAAELLGFKAQTLINWRHEKRGPAYRRNHGRVSYSLSDLEAYKAANDVRVEPAAEQTQGA
jgi:excisionase family DNA binding protein